MSAEPTNRRRPTHRHRGYKWHPQGGLYDRFAAWAEANGLLRSEALNQLVEDGLKVRRDAESDPTRDVGDPLHDIQSILGQVLCLQDSLGELALRLDLLGSTALTVVHAIVCSTALDPESQNPGEKRDQVEERILGDIFESSLRAWELLRPLEGEKPTTAGAAASGTPAIGTLLDYWAERIRAGSRDDESACMTAWQRQRVRAWARSRGLAPDSAVKEVAALIPRPHRGRLGASSIAAVNRERLAAWARAHEVGQEVALNALVDFALAHVDSSEEIRPWAVEEFRRGTERVCEVVVAVEARLAQLVHRVDLLGALLAGVPYLAVKWCAADESLEEESFDGDDEPGGDLEERLRLRFARESEELWRSQVEGLLEERAIVAERGAEDVAEPAVEIDVEADEEAED